MAKLCLYFNHPSQYREEIYKKISKEFGGDWDFEKSNTSIVTFDTKELQNTSWLAVRTFGNFYWTKGLLRLLRKDYDTYLMIGATRCLSLYFFLIFKNLFFRKKKVFLWTHGYYGKESWMEKNIFKRPLFKLADGVLVYGNYSRDLMIVDGFDPNKVLTIHNSLAYSKQIKLRNNAVLSDIYAKYFGNENPVLIFIGRLTPVKQLDMILDALYILKNRSENYNLVYVGDGPEKDVLEAKALELGLCDRIWFYGACYDEGQNAKLVYNADLCVAPGNIGLTAIHSLMFGCPAVTHKDFKWQMPEFEAIRKDVTGDFFERGNVNDLANVISHWFSSHKGDRNIVRTACYREIDEQWNPEFQIEVLKNFIK